MDCVLVTARVVVRLDTGRAVPGTVSAWATGTVVCTKVPGVQPGQLSADRGRVLLICVWSADGCFAAGKKNAPLRSRLKGALAFCRGSGIILG